MKGVGGYHASLRHAIPFAPWYRRWLASLSITNHGHNSQLKEFELLFLIASQMRAIHLQLNTILRHLALPRPSKRMRSRRCRYLENGIGHSRDQNVSLREYHPPDQQVSVEVSLVTIVNIPSHRSERCGLYLQPNQFAGNLSSGGSSQPTRCKTLVFGRNAASTTAGFTVLAR